MTKKFIHRTRKYTGMVVMGLVLVALVSLTGTSKAVAATRSTTPPLYGPFHLTPGQDLWLYPSRQLTTGPHGLAALHAQLRTTSPTPAKASTLRASSSGGCLSVTDRETGYENSGATAFFYQIGLTFCYNGSDVTSISTPTASWWTNTFYGLHNYGTYSHNYGSYAIGEGDFHVCYLGCIQSYDGYAIIEPYGYGGYSAFGDV